MTFALVDTAVLKQTAYNDIKDRLHISEKNPYIKINKTDARNDDKNLYDTSFSDIETTEMY